MRLWGVRWDDSERCSEHRHAPQRRFFTLAGAMAYKATQVDPYPNMCPGSVLLRRYLGSWRVVRL